LLVNALVLPRVGGVSDVKVMELTELPLKQLVPMFVTVLGIVMLEREVQFLKADPAMVCRLSGSVMLEREVH